LPTLRLHQDTPQQHEESEREEREQAERLVALLPCRYPAVVPKRAEHGRIGLEAGDPCSGLRWPGV